jgi:hypothetical protein
MMHQIIGAMILLSAAVILGLSGATFSMQTCFSHSSKSSSRVLKPALWQSRN